MHSRLRAAAVCAFFTLATSSVYAGTLVIESWRTDDKSLWEDVLLPAFARKHPGIDVKFAPTTPRDYIATVDAKLSAGTAGDLITCKPFDPSLDLYRKGRLQRLNGFAGLENFGDAAKVAWQTDSGNDTFCVPMASVIHGFFYNKKIFNELGLKAPGTEAEFFSLLDKVKTAGQYVPLDMGIADQWEATQVAFTGFGANYWKGEEGRKGLIHGRKKLTDPDFVGAWTTFAKWAPYLPKGFQTLTYAQSQALFASGKAAVFPAGSWDIAYFQQAANLDIGAFAPPVKKAGDRCYISDHTDIGMGINAQSKNRTEAKIFLTWLASAEFADLYTNKATGFFSLSNHKIAVTNPLAREMINWRAQCKSTIRLNAQILSRGKPSMETELWTVNSLILDGKLTPQDAAKRLQSGLETWYVPPQQ